MMYRHLCVVIVLVLGVAVAGCGGRDVTKGTAAAETKSALFTAIEKGDLETVKAELSQDPGQLNQPQGTQGETPLHKAAMAGQVAVARFLIENGAAVNAFDGLGRTPLVAATDAEASEEMVKLIKDSGGDD